MLIRRQKTKRFQPEPEVQVTEKDAQLAAGLRPTSLRLTAAAQKAGGSGNQITDP